MTLCALQSTVPVHAVLVGLEKSATNEFAVTDFGVPVVLKTVPVWTSSQNSVILGLENAFAKLDGTAKTVADLAHFTLMVKVAKTAATARITHCARP